MSVATQIRTLQKAWDVLAKSIVEAEGHIKANWTAYAQVKTRVVNLEKRMTGLEERGKTVFVITLENGLGEEYVTAINMDAAQDMFSELMENLDPMGTVTLDTIVDSGKTEKEFYS